MSKQLNALKVMTLNPKIRAFLEQNDPMALRQVEEAIADAEKPKFALLKESSGRPVALNPTKVVMINGVPNKKIEESEVTLVGGVWTTVKGTVEAVVGQLSDV